MIQAATELAANFDPNLPETPLVSPSQISTFRACIRKWALEKLAGLRSPSTPSQALGTDVDDNQLQPYLREGRPFDFTTANKSGDIAASGLKYLPQPKTAGLEVQRHFLLPSPSSTPGEYAPFAYQGYLDLSLPLRGLPDMPQGDFDEGGYFVPIVSDFKTMKDLKWAKTPAQLERDPQAVIYAAWMMHETGARVVDLAWINFQTTKGRKASRTEHRVDAELVMAELLEIDKTAREIMRTRAELEGREDKKAAALTLEPSPSECKAFGGCPHQAICNLSPLQIIDGLAAQAARRKGLPIMSNTPAPAGSLLERMRLKKLAAAGEAPTKPPPHFGSPESAPAPTEIPTAFLPAPAVGINPPESTLPPAPPVGTAAPASPAPAAPPPKRGRPPKAPADAPPTPVLNGEAGLAFDVSWAEERFCPVAYQSFGVGPFKATGIVQEGETLGEAMRRVSATLYAFATEERANKAEAFKRALGRGEAA